MFEGPEKKFQRHIDESVFELEKALCDGGFSEDQYDYHELVGVEIIPDKSIEM